MSHSVQETVTNIPEIYVLSNNINKLTYVWKCRQNMGTE